MIPPVDQPKGELRTQLTEIAAQAYDDTLAGKRPNLNPFEAIADAVINALATKQAGPQATTVGRHDSKETLARVVATLTEFGMPPEGEVDQFEWLRERLALIGIPGAEAGPPLTIIYTNWRGETAERHVIPITLWFGGTEWHPEPQYLLKALDADKGEERDFAWSGIDFQGDGPASAPTAGREQALEEAAKICREVRTRLSQGRGKRPLSQIDEHVASVAEGLADRIAALKDTKP